MKKTAKNFTAFFTRQWTRYTCPVATFRLVLHALTPHRISEWKGKRILGLRRGKGIKWAATVAPALRAYDLEAYAVKGSVEVLDGALDSGALVIVRDALTWRHWHVITVVGKSGNSYWVVDPLWGFPTRRSKARVLRSMAAGTGPGAIVARKK